jgi:hypothetical protein
MLKISNLKKKNFLKLFLGSLLKHYKSDNLKIKFYLIKSISTYIPYLGRPFSYLHSIILKTRFNFRVFFSNIRESNDSSEVKFVYINLAHRTDRRIHIENELKRLKIKNFERFDAISNSNGALGCLLSHKEVVSNWQNNEGSMLVIIEDDVIFKTNYDNLYKLLTDFYRSNYLDVLTLGEKRYTNARIDDNFSITDTAVGTQFYALKPYMKQPFLKMCNLCELMLNNNVSPKLAAVDVVWRVLQNRFFFAVPNENLVGLIESESDIII